MRRLLVLVSLAAIAGCDGDGTGGAVPLEDVPAELADVWCDAAESCLGRLADRTGAGPSCRATVEAETASSIVPLWAAAIDAGTATYDPALARQCLEATRAQGCDLFIEAQPAACRDFLIGTIALGERCSTSIECEGDAYCRGAGCPDVPGTCTARLGTGSPCGTTDECQTGLGCEDGVCRVPASASGGSCGGDSALGCPLDEVCVGSTAETRGTCTPYDEVLTRALGDACDFREAELCSPELSCAVTGATATGITASCVAIAPSGGSCFGAVPDMCPLGEYCDAQPATGALEGTCRPEPAEGEACGRSLSTPVCAQGLECVTVDDTPTCIRPKDNGAACDSAAECRSGRCVGGACAPPVLCP